MMANMQKVRRSIYPRHRSRPTGIVEDLDDTVGLVVGVVALVVRAAVVFDPVDANEVELSLDEFSDLLVGLLVLQVIGGCLAAVNERSNVSYPLSDV